MHICRSLIWNTLDVETPPRAGVYQWTYIFSPSMASIAGFSITVPVTTGPRPRGRTRTHQLITRRYRVNVPTRGYLPAHRILPVLLPRVAWILLLRATLKAPSAGLVNHSLSISAIPMPLRSSPFNASSSATPYPSRPPLSTPPTPVSSCIGPPGTATRTPLGSITLNAPGASLTPQRTARISRPIASLYPPCGDVEIDCSLNL